MKERNAVQCELVKLCTQEAETKFIFFILFYFIYVFIYLFFLGGGPKLGAPEENITIHLVMVNILSISRLPLFPSLTSR